VSNLDFDSFLVLNARCSNWEFSNDVQHDSNDYSKFRLSGDVPVSIMNLLALKRIDFGNQASVIYGHPNELKNSVTSLPDQLPPSLRVIEMNHNELTKFPAKLLECTNLEVINVRYNAITAFPKYIEKLVNLQIFDAAYNQIAEPIPEDLPQCVSLRSFDVGHNKISGDLSNIEFQELVKLQTFMIDHNFGITGELPETIITSWVDIDYISLYETQITGHLSSLCIDLRLCQKFQFDALEPQTWATEVPDEVAATIELAKAAAEAAEAS
jgi:hypothetical protein